jgi:hypothetical protein
MLKSWVRCEDQGMDRILGYRVTNTHYKTEA